MLRTHKPRGYAWNCASLFQQTPDFRNISYEDSQVDQKDDFGTSERPIKRQRVEKLADDFLNGHSLYISSARLPPQGIHHAVARSFTRPKDARRAMAGIETSNGTDAVWEDVQDEWETLRDHNQADEDYGQVVEMTAADSDEEEVIVEVHAQASCSSHRRQRIVKLSIGPSDEALRQAAALRNRTLLRRSGRLSVPTMQRAQSEAMVEETQEDSSRSSLQATASDIGPTPTAAWTSSKWLNSGMLELRHKAVDEECSKDELGLSSLPTPSQKAAARPAVSLRRGRSALSQQSSGVTSGVRSITGDTLSSSEPGARSSDRTNGDSEMPEGTAYVLVPPPKESRQEEHGGSQEDSQTQLLRRQGIRAAPRKSWTSYGRTVVQQADSIANSDPILIEEPALSHITRASIQEAANMPANKTQKGKRATKSTGAALPVAHVPSRRASSRRKSAPSESQTAAVSMTGIPVEQQRRMGSFRAGDNTYMSVPGKDCSPFIFRKRVSRFNNSEDPDIETLVVERKSQQIQTKTPKRVEFLPDDSQLVRAGVTITPAATDPETPLVNEYLNRLLPKSGDSGSRASSVRKALHDEMRLAGAEFSRARGDPQSSQPEAVASAEDQVGSTDRTVDEGELAMDIAPEMAPPQMWPGTQVLLAEAQKDLFTSPNKENTTMYLGDKTTPQTAREIPGRRPLQTLSQEHLPMPSTQALLDGWQGWSSIKKPRSAAGKRSSIIPSPSMGKGDFDSNLIGSDPGPTPSFDEAGLRKSILRYSISYSDSPDQQQTESLPVAAFFPPYRSTLAKSTSSISFGATDSSGNSTIPVTSDRAQRKAPRPSGGIASSAAFSQGQCLSTNGSTAVPSLSLHAGLSSISRSAPTVQQRQQESSISFSPAMRPEPRSGDTRSSAVERSHLGQQMSSISFSPVIRSEAQNNQTRPAAVEPPRVGLSTLLTEKNSWSFSPLAQPLDGERLEETTIDYGTPAAPLSDFQQAQDPAGSDASRRFLETVDMDSQELDFTVTDIMDDVLGSARRDMPQGMAVLSQ